MHGFTSQKSFNDKSLNLKFENFMSDEKLSSHKSSISRDSSEKLGKKNELSKNAPLNKKTGIQNLIQESHL